MSTGLWLVASHKLGYPVAADEPYPHIHATSCSCHPWQEFRRRDCAACAGQNTTGADIARPPRPPRRNR
jgi:hypothetical protein